MKTGTLVQHVNDRIDISPVGMVMNMRKNKAGKEVASVLWDSDILVAPMESLYNSWEFTDKLVELR